MEPTPSGQSPDLLADFDIQLYQANGNLRFVNWLIDRLVFWLFFKGFNMLWGKFMMAAMYNEEYWVRYTMSLLFSFFLYGIFLGAIEAICKGKTLGKLITGTRAVNWDGTPISPKTAFLRGLCRMVPFEPLSALGKPPFPWHDKWTKTCVIEENKSVISE